MSQPSPNWYPDPSGTYAQRYHDGAGWTEHVMDAAGNRSASPIGQPATQAQAPSAEYGQQDPYGQQQAQAGYGRQPGYGQQDPYGQQAGYGQQPPASGFTPTIGLIVAGVGTLALLASVFAMDFVTFSVSGFGSDSLSFSDLRKLESAGLIEVSGRSGLYIKFPYVFAFIAAAAGIVGALRLPQMAAYHDQMPRGVSIACGLLLFYHLMAAFAWDTGPGESASPALGAWVGALGYAALAAAPWLTQPLGQPGGQQHQM